MTVTFVDLYDLQENWGGEEGLSPLAQEMIDAAKELDRLLREGGFPAPLRICPTGDGSVCFEWRTSAGEYIELEMTGQRKAELRFVPKRPPQA